MRILIKYDDDTLSVILITEMYYNDEGLFVVDYSGDVLLYPGMDKLKSKHFCSDLYMYGYCNLSSHDFVWVDDTDEEV